jgi:hypothetical protein
MPHNGIISAITASNRNHEPVSMTTHASTEDERLIFGTPGNGRNSQTSDGESTPTQANYGSLLERDLSTRKDDDRLDGNDADVWRNVPSHWPNSVGRNQDQCSNRSRSRPQSVFSCQPLKQGQFVKQNSLSSDRPSGADIPRSRLLLPQIDLSASAVHDGIIVSCTCTIGEIRLVSCTISLGYT